MRILNRRAYHDYIIYEKVEAGIALTGSEVKSIKLGRADLKSSFVRLREGEAWLIGTNIQNYTGSQAHRATRDRKLLLHKDQLISLTSKMKGRGLTLVPISLYTKGRLIKAELALGKGKKQYEKREAKRRKDLDRELEQEIRGKA